MPDWLNYTLVGVMWVIVLGRGIAMRHTQGHLLIWLALTSGITSTSIEQVPVVAERITAWAGTPALAFTLYTVLALAAVTWVNAFFIAAAVGAADASRRKRRWYLWRATSVVSIALTVIAYTGRLDIYSTYTAVGEHHASPHQLAMIVLFEVTLLGNLVVMAYLFATLSRRESNIAVRWALRVLTVTSIGSGSRTLYTLTTIITPHPPWRWSTPVVLRMNMVWYFFAFIGITVLGVVGLAQQRTARRQLEALAPLHQALAQALPGQPVRCDDPGMPVEQALIARYTRIEDGLRQLRAHSDPAVLVQARQSVQARWVPGRKRREAIAIAAWIRLMLHRLERGIRLEANDEGFPNPSTSSINQDIAQLVRVAVAFERHPLVARFVELYEAAQADQSSLTG